VPAESGKVEKIGVLAAISPLIVRARTRIHKLEILITFIAGAYRCQKRMASFAIGAHGMERQSPTAI
jgi:hypothetical protein